MVAAPPAGTVSVAEAELLTSSWQNPTTGTDVVLTSVAVTVPVQHFVAFNPVAAGLIARPSLESAVFGPSSETTTAPSVGLLQVTSNTKRCARARCA